MLSCCRRPCSWLAAIYHRRSWCHATASTAMHLSPTSKVIALCSVANFINSADRVIMPIAIIPIAEIHGWDLYWQGWILSAFAFGYISSQILIVLSSAKANKWGPKRTLTFAVFLWSMSTLITPFVSSSVLLLLVFRMLLGFGEGLGLPTVFHIFAHSIPTEERSRAFSYLIGFGSIGQTFASLLCPHLPWAIAFYGFGLLGIVWVLFWMYYYSEQPEVIEFEFLMNPKKDVERWSEFFLHWPFWSIYIAHFAMNWSSYIFMHWLPTYLSKHLGANSESISLTAVPYIFNSVGGLAAGHLADKMVSNKDWGLLPTRRLMTCIGLVGPAIFILCFSYVNSVVFAVIFVSLSMCLLSFNSAGHLSNHADIAPNHAGITFAISNTIATIPGMLCGPVTAQLVMQSQNRWWPVFVLAATINLVGAIIFCSQSSARHVF